MWMDAMRKWLFHIQFTLSKGLNQIKERKAKKSKIFNKKYWESIEKVLRSVLEFPKQNTHFLVTE